MTENTQDSHWVAELFPPAFQLSLSDVLADKNVLRSREASEQLASCGITGEYEKIRSDEKESSVFQQLARDVSPLDVSTIRNVYERVWLMSKLEDEERNETKQRMYHKMVQVFSLCLH